MENEELKVQVKKVASEAAGVTKEAVDKTREFAERTFTRENAEALKQNAAKITDNAKDFAKKVFTKENAERARKAAKDELAKLTTAEGRDEAKSKLINRAKRVAGRIVAIWESGTKGKVLIAVAGVLVLLALKCCLTSEPEHEAMPIMEGTAQREQPRCIQRCQYCFRETLSGTWDPPSPCRPGRGHSYESIGTQGARHFRCSKCGKEYDLQYEPRGYIHCPRGQACQWREL